MRDAMRAVQGMLIKQHPKLMAVGDLPFGPASSLGEEPYRATGTALDYMCAGMNHPRHGLARITLATAALSLSPRSRRR